MTIDPDIRDQAYQFFIEEASELLDIIETGLLSLRPDITVQKVHEIMRAAHSIKGGAASVGLGTIKTIAHRLEDAFKALYSDMVIVDSELETLLLRAYDCLRYPLQSQIATGTFNEKQALAAFESIFNDLEIHLGPALAAADSFIPSSSDLGVDIVASIFELDVAEILAQLRDILHNPQSHDCSQVLQNQLEVLTGFAELIEIPQFIELVTTAQIAAHTHPNQPLLIIEQIVSDVDHARTAILSGNQGALNGPSEALLALATSEITQVDHAADKENLPQIDNFDLADLKLDIAAKSTDCDIDSLAISLSELDSSADEISTLEEIWTIDAMEFPEAEKIENEASSKQTLSEADALADVWGDIASTAATPDAKVTGVEALITESLSDSMMESRLSPISDKSVDKNVTDPIESAQSLVDEMYDSLPRLPKQGSFVQAKKKQKSPIKSTTQSSLSAKIALDRLEKINSLIGELAINRSSLSLQNEQFQRTVGLLGQRFSSFRTVIKRLQTISDKFLVSHNQQSLRKTANPISNKFDSLEMDSYSEMHPLLEEVLEEVFQLAESIDDVNLFTGQADQLLRRQQRTLTQLRDELMWARMVPLERVLKRFPRVVRDLSNSHQKPVQLKLTGTDVLIDRVMLEKLYDPLLHLLRNAFDHGIEPPERRQALGKPQQGTIEIRACHKGNYTVIEIADDGQGLDLDKITQRALEAQLLLPEQIKTLPEQHIQQLIFEPGFSTAATVSELSGRGIGLDIVKERLQTFNGKISLTTMQRKGTVFSLKIPLTLTLTKLIIGSTNTTAIALASDSIKEIVRPANKQLKKSGNMAFLHWQKQLIRVYKLDQLLSYQCLPPERLPQELQENQRVKSEQPIMLIIQQDQTAFALELQQIIKEQELVIKPMGKAIASPHYINGCTVLADGSLVPVIDGAALVQFDARPSILTQTQKSHRKQSQTLMIVDDSSALRRTLAITLQKAGYRILQARDGRDALEQLRQGAMPELIICDVEMPRLNGFDFLSQRRANSVWAQIPTVMLTSRDNPKHRLLAKQLGATDYLTKPYIEREFVGAIANLLRQN